MHNRDVCEKNRSTKKETGGGEEKFNHYLVAVTFFDIPFIKRHLNGYFCYRCPLVGKKIIGNFRHERDRPQPGQTIVYAPFKAFKFPDRQDVYFECQVHVCFRECYPVGLVLPL